MTKTGKSMLAVMALSVLVGVLSIIDVGSLRANGADGTPQPLFQPANPPDGYTPADDDTSSRSRPVYVDFDLVSNPDTEQLLLNLFEDTSFAADRHRLAGNTDHNFTWVGHIHGRTDGQVTLVVRNGEILVGNIILPGAVYQVRYVGEGVHVVTEINEAGLPPHQDPIPVELPPSEAGDALAVAAAGEDDGSTIDVMVVYTPDARIAEGGTAAMEALIDLAIEETNNAFANSRITPRLRLVHTGEVNYAEAGDMSGDLSKLRVNGDGVMDEVHTWRDTYNADQVTLIEATGGYCGIAYLMSTVTTSFEPYAFSVVHRSCATGYYSFGHEWGHNAGSHHDRANAGGSAAYEYSYGYQAPNAAFRTVLAYNCPAGCSRIPYYSNPNVSYGGQPTGIDATADPTNSADNARSINNVAFTMANFRVSGIGPTELPAAASGLVATATSESTIGLVWSDDALNETGFELERSLDGTNWQLLDTLPADSVAYTDSGLDPSTTYYYRVRSYNGLGYSDYSNVAQATTDDPSPYSEVEANSEILVAGTVSGTYANTQASDGVNETITERSSGGKPQHRYSYLIHKWVFDVPAANIVTFNVLGHRSDSQDGDTFVLAYSTDDINYTDMVVIDDLATPPTYDQFALPSSTQGQVFVRVMDTDQTPGNLADDQVFIDHMFIAVTKEAGTPPAAPSIVEAVASAPTQVDLSWIAGGSDETGFEVRRSTDQGASWSVVGTTGQGTTRYMDADVSPNTGYEYRVYAFNGSGSTPSDETVSVTTPMGLGLNATGYKVKGMQHTDLNWTGANGNVDVLRNGAVVASDVSGRTYTDNVGSKGSGTYEYQVCPTGSQSGCSNMVTVVF